MGVQLKTGWPAQTGDAMDTRWLQDFLTLAEVGNFTHAAQLRYSSQAAFSRRIQSLEDWLGAKLVDRSRYPLHLTAAGEDFQRKAEKILAQLEGARVGKVPFEEQQNVRIALPYTLAVAWLPSWWKTWCGDQRWTCQTRVGSVLETTASFAAGAADILINYYQPAQRLPLDAAMYEKTVLLSETLRPYCAEKLLKKRLFTFPGTRTRPVPYFHYSPEVYFHPLLKGILENAGDEFCGTLLGESEMSEVLANFAAEGLGVVWLSDSSLLHRPAHKLVNLDKTGAWSVDVEVVAFMAKDNPGSHIRKIWRRMQGGY